MIISDPLNLSNEFNNFFTTVAEKIRCDIPINYSKNFKTYLKNRMNKSFFFSPVDNTEIISIINALDPNKSTGPYSIPSIILKTLLFDISDIIADIFNLSFVTGKFITSLKNVKVVPVYKNKGSPLDINNYRPISLLSNIDKIFEKLVHSRLVSFLNSNNLLSNKQFGFRKKHSTIHALIA